MDVLENTTNNVAECYTHCQLSDICAAVSFDHKLLYNEPVKTCEIHNFLCKSPSDTGRPLSNVAVKNCPLNGFACIDTFYYFDSRYYVNVEKADSVYKCWVACQQSDKCDVWTRWDKPNQGCLLFKRDSNLEVIRRQKGFIVYSGPKFCPSKALCAESNFRYEGPTVGSEEDVAKELTLEKCQRLCEGNANCTAYTRRAINWQYGTEATVECQLFSKITARNFDSRGVTSGNKNCSMFKEEKCFNFYAAIERGRGVFDLKSASSPKPCQRICTEEPKCRYFDFDLRLFNCHLYEGVYELRSDQGHVTVSMECLDKFSEKNTKDKNEIKTTTAVTKSTKHHDKVTSTASHFSICIYVFIFSAILAF